MGWTQTYNAGKTKEHVIGEVEGDPLACATCGYHEAAHPRIAWIEYDELYGTTSHANDAPHDFVPRIQAYKVIDYSATLTVAYMAVECLTDGYLPKGSVFASITLIRRSRDGSITTKEMSESMGPYDYTCPARILDKLSPIEALYTGTSAEYASKWREGCRARLAMKASRPKLSNGTIFRLKAPLSFTNGEKYDTFEVQVSTFTNRRIFRAYPNGPRVTINGLREMAYDLVA